MTTDLDLHAETVWRMCRGRADCENRIKELMYDFAADSTEARKPILNHCYLSGRIDQLHYDQALRHGLPIGSGEIESAHRYFVQQRLKHPGAWWRTHNAEHMLSCD